MENYYYSIYNPELINDWKYVFNDSPDSWMYHDMELCEYIAGQHSAKNHSIIIYNSQEKTPVAICPLFIYKQNYGRMRPAKKIAESYYQSGPAFIRKFGRVKRREVLNFMTVIIEALINTEKIDICVLSSANLSEFGLTAPNFYTNPLHELRGNWQNRPTAYFHLDLRPAEEELKSNLEIQARARINKIEKSGLCEIKKATIADAEVIYNLWLDTHKRAGLPPHPKSDTEWWLNYPYARHYVAYMNGIPASVVRLNIFKGSAYYNAGFTGNDFVKDQVNTYLLWKCILTVKKEESVKDFSLGLEEFKPVGSKWDNIAKFKRNFGPELRYKFESVYKRKSALKKIFNKISDVL